MNTVPARRFNTPAVDSIALENFQMAVTTSQFVAVGITGHFAQTPLQCVHRRTIDVAVATGP